jgi:hypothetical protein
LSEDRSFLRVDVRLTSFWHRSPKHVWVQDREELIFDVEPADATIRLSVQLDDARARTSIVRFPETDSTTWPLTVTRSDLFTKGRPAMLDRRRPGVHLYGQRSRDPACAVVVSDEVKAALEALGYLQDDAGDSG